VGIEDLVKEEHLARTPVCGTGALAGRSSFHRLPL